MTPIIEKAFKQGLWLSTFRFSTQVVAWCSTIVIARLLSTEDYGLMGMATVLTGYAMIFTELGFGAAIIQRPNHTPEELSSVFWFTVIMGFIFGGCCFALAYPTALIFNEPRVIPLTQAVSIIFILNGLKIVPVNLLKKNLSFKKIGIIEMTSSVTSIAVMVVVAWLGGGAWTLLLGHISRSLIQTILYFINQNWRPRLYFKLSVVKIYLNFGIFVILASTFLYVFERSDEFFGGIYWSAATLGLYNFAILLARIPNNKLMSLIKQVSYPVFSIFQNEGDKFKQFYLNICKLLAIIIFPLYIGGSLTSKELITVLLDEKWYPIIPIFRVLCLSQIFLALSSINDAVNNSLARPSWPMFFHGACALVMSISFYFAAKHGINAMLIPWITFFPILCLCYIFVTSLKINVGLLDYLKNLAIPIIGSVVMGFVVFFCGEILVSGQILPVNKFATLGVKITSGVLTYGGFLLVFDRSFLARSYALFKRDRVEKQGDNETRYTEGIQTHGVHSDL